MQRFRNSSRKTQDCEADNLDSNSCSISRVLAWPSTWAWKAMKFLMSTSRSSCSVVEGGGADASWCVFSLSSRSGRIRWFLALILANSEDEERAAGEDSASSIFPLKCSEALSFPSFLVTPSWRKNTTAVMHQLLVPGPTTSPKALRSPRPQRNTRAPGNEADSKEWESIKQKGRVRDEHWNPPNIKECFWKKPKSPKLHSSLHHHSVRWEEGGEGGGTEPPFGGKAGSRRHGFCRLFLLLLPNPPWPQHWGTRSCYTAALPSPHFSVFWLFPSLRLMWVALEQQHKSNFFPHPYCQKNLTWEVKEGLLFQVCSS